MPKQVWIFASVLSVLVLLGFAGLTVRQQARDARELRAQLDQSAARLESLTNQLHLAKTQIEDLQQQNDAASQAQKNLEQEMRKAIESKEITISQLQGKLTVNILDRILFDSGEAVLKPEGEAVLKQIAGVLAQFPQRQIHVIGHTDNVPIRIGPRAKYASNWELSTARAIAAVRFLCENAEVDPRRLGAVGYGEFHPIADNSTPEGRAKNRRIALVVLSEELVGSDAGDLARVVPVKLPATNAAPAVEAVTNPPIPTRIDIPTFANPPAIGGSSNTPEVKPSGGADGQ